MRAGGGKDPFREGGGGGIVDGGWKLGSRVLDLCSGLEKRVVVSWLESWRGNCRWCGYSPALEHEFGRAAVNGGKKRGELNIWIYRV